MLGFKRIVNAKAHIELSTNRQQQRPTTTSTMTTTTTATTAAMTVAANSQAQTYCRSKRESRKVFRMRHDTLMAKFSQKIFQYCVLLPVCEFVCRNAPIYMCMCLAVAIAICCVLSLLLLIALVNFDDTCTILIFLYAYIYVLLNGFVFVFHFFGCYSCHFYSIQHFILWHCCYCYCLFLLLLVVAAAVICSVANSHWVFFYFCARVWMWPNRKRFVRVRFLDSAKIHTNTVKSYTSTHIHPNSWCALTLSVCWSSQTMLSLLHGASEKNSNSIVHMCDGARTMAGWLLAFLCIHITLCVHKNFLSLGHRIEWLEWVWVFI